MADPSDHADVGSQETDTEMGSLVRDRIDLDGNVLPPGPSLDDWPSAAGGEPDAPE